MDMTPSTQNQICYPRSATRCVHLSGLSNQSVEPSGTFMSSALPSEAPMSPLLTLFVYLLQVVARQAHEIDQLRDEIANLAPAGGRHADDR